MYSNKDLEFLKHEYMEQDYPEDLNNHILTCIAKSSLNSSSQEVHKKSNIYMKFALVACLSIAMFSVFQNRGGDVNLDKNKIVTTRSVFPETNYLSEEDSVYKIFENDSIISIYPSNKEITIEDKIYNIDKVNGNMIELKDILVDDVRAVEIEEILKDILEDENSKFYIDFDGTYVIIGMGSLVRVDTILQNKIFKTEYILK
ncbi:hypothetical protein [Candidatus Arthromitus sp. SFB-turkey]|uniref:hypothetical protein n=1 Tax=Candidatus Arthromitus sp. SFB-turkey TaxID=1840217 RepID=UPI0007F53874|nr:hypothetical protein [Candidatus Arthromitus sp. SFB-turkey]OAT89668.1 hypothetical protein A6P36_02930 [Candidatus Arthromitus sp. SFB-turkey]